MKKNMETTTMGYTGYRIWGKWGSYYSIPKAIFHLLKGDCIRGTSGVALTDTQAGTRYVGCSQNYGPLLVID